MAPALLCCSLLVSPCFGQSQAGAEDLADSERESAPITLDAAPITEDAAPITEDAAPITEDAGAEKVDVERDQATKPEASTPDKVSAEKVTPEKVGTPAKVEATATPAKTTAPAKPIAPVPSAGTLLHPGRVPHFREGRVLEFCCNDCSQLYTQRVENRLDHEERHQGWRLLFDGQDISAFQDPTRDCEWQVVDGVLVGHGGKGVLGTCQSFGDFRLRVDLRLNDQGSRRGETSIFLRSSGLEAYRARWPDGYSLPIRSEPTSEEADVPSVLDSLRSPRVIEGQWFQLEVEALGRRVRAWIDGELVRDEHLDGEALPGPISFQVHHPSAIVEIKNLKILPFQRARRRPAPRDLRPHRTLDSAPGIDAVKTGDEATTVKPATVKPATGGD